jgi:hypothetical protein
MVLFYPTMQLPLSAGARDFEAAGSVESTSPDHDYCVVFRLMAL